jgi:hypothetical protein
LAGESVPEEVIIKKEKKPFYKALYSQVTKGLIYVPDGEDPDDELV